MLKTKLLNYKNECNSKYNRRRHIHKEFHYFFYHIKSENNGVYCEPGVGCTKKTYD